MNQQRNWVGSSAVPGVLGVSPFSDPCKEWMALTGRAPELTKAKEEFFAYRKALEPYVRQIAETKFGLRIIEQNVRYTDKAMDYLRAEIDFEAEDTNGEIVNGEIKTVHPWAAKGWGPSGSDDFPVYVAAQTQTALTVRDRKRAVVIACIGFDDHRLYNCNRDDDVCGVIRSKVDAFWNGHVLPGIAPEPTTLENVKLLYPRSAAVTKQAPDEIVAYLNRLVVLDAQQAMIDFDRDVPKLRITEYFGEADTLVDQNGQIIATWKSPKDSLKTDWEQIARDMMRPLPVEARKSLIDTHTKAHPNSRRLLNKLKNERKQ